MWLPEGNTYRFHCICPTRIIQNDIRKYHRQIKLICEVRSLDKICKQFLTDDGTAKSNQRAYVLHPALSRSHRACIELQRFVRIIRETRHPGKIVAKELTEKERRPLPFSVSPMQSCTARQAGSKISNSGHHIYNRCKRCQ